MRDRPPSSTHGTYVSSKAGVHSILIIQNGDREKLVSEFVVSDILVPQSRATSDGFLSSAEYSLWASTMKLQDGEAHPTLKQSHFMSIPSDLPPQVFFLFEFLFVCFCLGGREDNVDENKADEYCFCTRTFKNVTVK